MPSINISMYLTEGENKIYEKNKKKYNSLTRQKLKEEINKNGK